MENSEVASHCHAAVDYVERSLGRKLPNPDEDLSVTLAFVDHYIQKTRPLEGPTHDLVAAAIGVWFGEQVRRVFDGKWVTDGPARTWRVELAPVELRFHPVGMAAEALRGGPVAGYDASFATKPALMADLTAALAASGPVEEHYYYSLTGRFETLAHAVEIIAELGRINDEEAAKA